MIGSTPSAPAAPFVSPAHHEAHASTRAALQTFSSHGDKACDTPLGAACKALLVERVLVDDESQPDLDAFRLLRRQAARAPLVGGEWAMARFFDRLDASGFTFDVCAGCREAQASAPPKVPRVCTSLWLAQPKGRPFHL